MPPVFYELAGGSGLERLQQQVPTHRRGLVVLQSRGLAESPVVSRGLAASVFRGLAVSRSRGLAASVSRGLRCFLSGSKIALV